METLKRIKIAKMSNAEVLQKTEEKDKKLKIIWEKLNQWLNLLIKDIFGN